MYRIGELDQRIAIQRETVTPDGMGGGESALSTVATTWAHVRPKTGKEGGAFDGVRATAVYLFVIRNRKDLKDDDRIVWDGDTYNIRYIAKRGGRNMFLQIEAERGAEQ